MLTPGTCVAVQIPNRLTNTQMRLARNAINQPGGPTQVHGVRRGVASTTFILTVVVPACSGDIQTQVLNGVSNCKPDRCAPCRPPGVKMAFCNRKLQNFGLQGLGLTQTQQTGIWVAVVGGLAAYLVWQNRPKRGF